jgi:nicotinamidase/pyrazinamidase
MPTLNFIKNKIASFDVDPQKGFTELCPDELPIPEGHLIVDELNKNAKMSHFRVGSRDMHPMDALWNAETPSEMLDPVGLPNVDVKWIPHCRVGTRGSELLDGLPHPFEGYDFMVSKGMDKDVHPYGACYHDLGNKKSTGVIEFLKMNGVGTVIVGGLATEYCVLTTILQLLDAEFTVIVNKASIRGLDGAEKAIADMSKMDGVLLFNNAIEIQAYIK